jgi:hypothetical protein
MHPTSLHLGGVRRVAAALLIAALLLAVAGTPGLASEQPAEGADAPGLRDLPGNLPVPAPQVTDAGQERKGAKSLWVWSKGRRGFQIADQFGIEGGFETLVAYDLDTLEEAGRTTLSPRAYKGQAAIGLPHMADVAEDEGLFVVGYQVDGMRDGATGTAQGVFADSSVSLNAGTKEMCLLVFPGCFGGVLVLDAQTLDVVKRIPFTPVSVDGGAVGATLRALRYVPKGEGGASDGKILAVVEEWVSNPAGTSQVEQPRYQGANLVYVIQFDPQTGTQEWVVRADGCRGAREPKDAGAVGTASSRPYPAAVFRTIAGAGAGVPAVMVACHSGSSQTGAVVKIPLDERGYPDVLPAEPGDPVAAGTQALDQGADATAGPQDIVIQNAAQQLFTGPDKVYEVFPDPGSGRVLMKVVDGNPNAEVWWVFDSRREQFVGTIGVGAFGPAETQAVLDETSGRLYVIAPPQSGVGYKGGIFVADTRRTPLAQALVFPDVARDSSGGPPAVDPAADGRPARLFTRVADDLYRVVEDTIPLSVDLAVETYVGRTLDLDEVDGVTAAAFDGAARGYGVRALLVGGADAMLRNGPVDPTGQYYGTQDAALRATVSTMGESGQRALGLPLTSPCTEASREIVLGAVGPAGPAVVDASGGRAGAEPIVADSGLRTDAEKPVSRCLPVDWTELWSKALFTRAPVAEPEAMWPFGAGTADCVSSAETPSASFSDPTTGWFSAAVECGQQEISGWSRARAVDVDALGLTVAEASSKFTVYRDPGRGIVARVESVARGVDLTGVLRVDSVRVIAESWANGRRQPVTAADRGPDYDPNCDLERSAGTCFVRSVTGVWTPGWSCGPCGDEATMVDRMNKAIGANGKVALREPDPRMAAGAENGYIAAIQKPDHERFADLVLNNDLLQTVVPGLEIIRYTAPNRTIGGGGPRGRQVYQFAGTEVSSSYGISCLLVYDAADNSCAVAQEPPGSITLSLADTDGKPLAGGAFELRRDGDADGVLGLEDALVPDGACVTAADGVGTCTFTELEPGSYLVIQTAAPAGYARQADPYKVDLGSGEARKVEFQNASNMSVVQVKATDEAGRPLAGAVFAVMPDPDADGKAAAGAKPAATCITDAAGSCAMRVPAGSYVLVQTGAPGGLTAVEPVAFTLASGGQTAAVGVVNYPPGAPAAPEPAAAPVYSEPSAAAPPVESVEAYEPPVADEGGGLLGDVPQAVGGTIVRIIAAPGDTLRLLAREPKEAVAWVASLALFAAALLAVRRRQAAMALVRVSDDAV